MTSVQEEISKIAFDLLKEASRHAIQFGSDLSSDLAQMSKNTFLMIINEVEKREKQGVSFGDKMSLRKLKKAVEKNNETPRQITLSEVDASALKKYLETDDILFAVLKFKSDSKEAFANSDKRVVCFLDKDAPVIFDALSMIQADRGLINEVAPAPFVKYNNDRSIFTADGLSEQDVELLRHWAPKLGFVFAVMPSQSSSDNPEFKVIARTEDKSKVAAALHQACWDLTGEHGPAIQRQIEYKLSGKKQINLALQDTIGEHYIVNGGAPGDYIHITSKDFSFYKNNKLVQTVGRTDSSFADRYYDNVSGFKSPVVFEKEEFAGEKSKREELVKEKNSVYPPKFDEALHRAQAALVASKALKRGVNNENSQDPWWIYASDIDLSLGQSYENIDDMRDSALTGAESRHFAAASERARQYKLTEYPARDMSLDREIAEAAKRTYMDELSSENFSRETLEL